MYIAEVLPFTKSLHKEHLSYFSSKDIEPGSVVHIEVRKKTIPGLVLTCKDATEEKSDLKSKDFSLKKVKKILPKSPLRKELCQTIKKAADYFGTFPSSIINILLPTSIIAELDSMPTVSESPKRISKPSGEKYIIQDTKKERESHYRNILRNSFVHHESVMLVCPTIEDTSRLGNALARGIESQTFVFHSKMSASKIKKTWTTCVKNEKPVVIICTPTYVSVPRHDLGAIIVEKESASAYTSIKRPIIDITKVIEMFAHEMSIRFYRGDTLLTLKTIHGMQNDEYHEYSPARFRFLTSAETKLINMKGAENNESNKAPEFKIISDELERVIKNSHQDNERVFVFASRTGLASSIICSDCGTLVTCSWCSNPVVLHGKDPTKNDNTFRCHSCGEERSAGELCKHCDSWRLKTLGIGSEGVYKEITKIIPKDHVFLLDSAHVKTQIQARKIVEEFMSQPGSVLVGTEMALLYLHDSIEHIAVASIDSLFSIPNFDMREKIMRILLQLRDMASQTLIVQTRKKDEILFDYALRGNGAEFVRSELSARKKFNYPPYAIIVKITGAGNKKEIEDIFTEVQKYLKPNNLVTFPSFTEEVRGQFVMNGIIRLRPEDWINKELLEKLRSLPPYLKVVVDAQSLL